MTEVENMIRENVKLTYYVIATYFPYFNGDEDVREIALIGIWKAFERYDKEQSASFSTFAVKVIKNEILNFLRTNREFKHNIILVSLDTGVTEENAQLRKAENPLLLQQVLSKEIDLKSIFEKLTDEEQEILLDVINKKTYDEIAEKLHTSQSTITRKVEVVRKKLKKELEENQFFKYSS